MGGGGGSGGGGSPCASCKLLRRRCRRECIFAPYFPSDDPHKFAIVHKVFGASNVSKLLQEIPIQQRADAVSSLVYEANARVRDPVYGCVGAISYLQNQVSQLQMQLALAQAEILCIQMPPQLPPDQYYNLEQDDDHRYPNSMLLPNHNIHNNNITSTTTSTDDHIITTAAAANNNSLPTSPLGAASYNDINYFATSSSNVVIFQDPLKTESLWT